jgi:hydrogenase expression/formation protein HypD
MKYVDEYRDGALARSIAAEIGRQAKGHRTYRLMEFCGGHTHAISRYGLEDLLPGNVRLIHGPGCPVCVLPMARVDMAIACARLPGVTLAAYGDLMRVPGSGGSSLMKARAEGADVRMVYSTLDAIRLAEADPDREVVFFAIGFETTTPATALAIRSAQRKGLRNFSVLCNHVMTPPAMRAILDGAGEGDEAPVMIEGFIGPAHVSTVIGTRPYEPFARDDGKPVVIAGFEPLDVAQAILMLVRQINDGRAEVENQYIRAVTPTGNLKAQAEMAAVFETRDAFEWRGLGFLPKSALELRAEFGVYDAERRFGLAEKPAKDNPACECGAILRGAKAPRECRLFGTVCTPDAPMGSCMVSPEGACAAHWTYGRFRENARAASEKVVA